MNANQTKDMNQRAARGADRRPLTTQTPPSDDTTSDDALVVFPTKKGSGSND